MCTGAASRDEQDDHFHAHCGAPPLAATSRALAQSLLNAILAYRRLRQQPSRALAQSLFNPSRSTSSQPIEVYIVTVTRASRVTGHAEQQTSHVRLVEIWGESRAPGSSYVGGDLHLHVRAGTGWMIRKEPRARSEKRREALCDQEP